MATRSDRGFTLMELVTAMAISLVLTVLVVEALVGLAKDRSSREMVVEVQGEARLGLSMLERDIRAASLGAGTGVVWFQDPRATSATFNTRVGRPAVQIYDNVAGGGAVLNPPAKPNTDALLVVEALGTVQPPPAGQPVVTPRVAVIGDQFQPAMPPLVLPVTSAKAFELNGYALFGEYGDASWAQVTASNITSVPNTITLSNTVSLFRVRDGKLPSGSLVRPARARLYYVDTRDELVRVTLVAPVAPSDAADVVGREVLALAFENLQIGCQVDGGGVLAACPGVVADADATVSLGVAGSRLTIVNAPTLRTVSVSAVVRSRNPLREQHGDRPIPIGGQTLAPSGVTTLGVPFAPADEFVRRAYRIEVAVRNTSLGVL